MKLSYPSFEDDVDSLSSSPKMTSPSSNDRPFIYWLSSESGSSSFEESEGIPMLPNTDPLSSSQPCRVERRRKPKAMKHMKAYFPCIVFLVLAFWAYFYSFPVSRDIKRNESNDTIFKSMEPVEEIDEFALSNENANEDVPIDSFPKESPDIVETSNSAKQSNVIGVEREDVLDNNNEYEETAPKIVEPQETKHQEITANMIEQKKTKHNLVLHIGPQKTGSTTLQDAWSEPFGILSESLRRDNYRYRFIHPSSGFFDCDVNQYGGYINCEASTKLKSLIRTAKKDGQNLLLSDENLDNRFPETFREVIDSNDWDVTVIVVYRRIHQWLVSWYDQINKTTNKDAKGNILIDPYGHPYRREHTLWPDDGGVHIPTFSSWYKEFTQYWDSSELVGKHRSVSFMNAYKPYFKNIVVHDMHRDGDLMTNFMCDSMPDAPHSCNQLKRQTKRLPRDNQSVDLDFDILAVTARERGFLMTTYKRKFVVSRIQNFVKESKKTIPRVCDAEMIDEIRRWLLDSEKEMFRETWSEEKTSDLKETFDAYVESGKLCDIDFDQVFEDEEWLNFFQSLDNRPRLVLHIGPQKTGSTTLQHVWAAPKELRSVMKEDNFDYYFINPHRGTFDCELDKNDSWTNCLVSEKLLNILADASAERKNLLLSDENLDERFAGALREAISDKDFRVKIVLVYRKIHTWLPSWYSQINKMTNKDSNGNFLRNENDQPTLQPHTKWPSEGGVHVPNFSDWYRQYVNGFHSEDLAGNHPSIKFKNAYEPYFDHIEVYNMDQEGDMVTNFMCQMIPEAHKTCHRLKEGSVKLPLINPSVNVEHDILSVEAYERGLIGEGLSRPTVVEEVRKHLQNPGVSLPRRCDSELRKQIHDWLFESEKIMFPDSWSSSVSEALENQYEDYYDKGKLCDIDLEEALDDKSWIEFFTSLGKER